MPYRWRYDDPIGSPVPPIEELALHLRRLHPDVGSRLVEADALARRLQQRGEEALGVVVGEARWMRLTWRRIGDLLGMTKQGAHRRFRAFVAEYIEARRLVAPGLARALSKVPDDVLWVLLNEAIFDVLEGRDHMLLHEWVTAPDIRRWVVTVQRGRRRKRAAE